MNQQSTDSSISSRTGASAEAISQRAYEIWESEGRPEGCDLRHWLQAEQELGAKQNNGKRSETTARAESSNQRQADQRQPQPARNTPTPSTPTSAGRDTKRPPTAPFGEKNGTSSVSGQNTAKRKPAAAPVL